MKGHIDKYDYIIAGAGSAGCTLVARLCEDPSVKVLMVEAGGNGRSLFVDIPAGNGFIFGSPKFDWGLESIPQPGLNGNRCETRNSVYVSSAAKTRGIGVRD